MIDLDQLNPDWSLAQSHAKSTFPGKVMSNNHNIQRCPCCFRPIDLAPIGICQNSKELEQIGFAYPLYFKFIKYVIIMIFMQVISYNSLALYWSYIDNISFCQNGQSKQVLDGTIEHCTGFFVSIARLQYQIGWPETIIRICSFVVQLFVLMYIRDKISKTNSYYDERSTSLSDYSIIIKDLPAVYKIQSKIRRMFKQFFSKQYKIEEMVIIGHLKEYYCLESQKQKLIIRKKEMIAKKVQEDDLKSINYQIQQNQKLIEAEVCKQLEQAQKDQLLCEKVIIVLESDPIKEELINQFQYKSKIDSQKLMQIFKDDTINPNQDIDLPNDKIKINMRFLQAPQPNQIIWEHININRGQRYLRQFLGWLFTVLLIAILTVAFYFLLQFKSITIEHAIASQNAAGTTAHATAGTKQLQVKIYVLVYGSIFAIIFFNKFIIAPFLHLIAHFEKHPTKDKQQYSFALKYTLSLFFTTALMTLLVEDVSLHNIYKQDFGVVEEQSIMFFVNALFVPLLWLINPWYIFRIIKRKLKLGDPNITQKQANQIMEKSPISLGKLYAQVLQTVWFTYIYATIIPIGAMVTLVGIIIHYWIDKYNLLQKSSLSNAVSGRISIQALKLLDITLIMRPVGSLIFDFQIKNSYTIESIVCTGVALLYIMLPMNDIIQKIHKQQFNLQEKTYQEVKDQFITNYKTLHPILAFRKIYEKKQLKNVTFSNYKKNIQRKFSKKLSMSIQMSLMNSPTKRSDTSSEIKQILI